MSEGWEGTPALFQVRPSVQWQGQGQVLNNEERRASTFRGQQSLSYDPSVKISEAYFSSEMAVPVSFFIFISRKPFLAEKGVGLN